VHHDPIDDSDRTIRPVVQIRSSAHVWGDVPSTFLKEPTGTCQTMPKDVRRLTSRSEVRLGLRRGIRKSRILSNSSAHVFSLTNGAGYANRRTP
jgi:hypothetical protein